MTTPTLEQKIAEAAKASADADDEIDHHCEHGAHRRGFTSGARFGMELNGDGSMSLKGGLTKRELFAAMAMQGILASGEKPVVKGQLDWTLDIVDASIRYADALLAELGKGNEK